MSAHVISHRRPRRKRGGPSPRRSGYSRAGGWRSFLLRRFGALVVTIAALGAASWLAPYFYRPPAAPSAKVIQTPPLGNSSARPPAEIPETVEHTTEPQRQAQRPRRPRRGVALDAHVEGGEADFEVLSAAELDAISQARD